MPSYDWTTFLHNWSQDLLASTLAAVFPADSVVSGWIGFPGASETDLSQAEERLKTALPPSYRQFLAVTNGWRMVMPLLGRLWSTSELEWLPVRHGSMIAGWQIGLDYSGHLEPILDRDYLVYGDQQDTALFRVEYLQTALEISDHDPGDDAIYLLNPQTVTQEGEWEAWYFASWLPGAIRYPSFWELMQAEYQRFKAAFREQSGFPPEYLDYVARRLQPKDLSVKEIDLSELTSLLDVEIEKFSSPARPGTLPGYQKSISLAFEEAKTRIEEIQEQTADPQEQVRRLRLLADELNRLGREGTKALMKNLDLKEMLLSGLAYKLSGSTKRMDDQLKASGSPAGYQTAAERIRVFLD